jgi:hypothetical protein
MRTGHGHGRFVTCDTLQAVLEQLKELRIDISTIQGQQVSSPGKLAAYQEELKKDVSSGQEELKKYVCDIKGHPEKIGRNGNIRQTDSLWTSW